MLPVSLQVFWIRFFKRDEAGGLDLGRVRVGNCLHISTS